MKLLALPRHGRLAASSRLRTYQYIPWFQQCGIEVETLPLLDDYYLQARYSKKRAVGSIVFGYLSRIRSLLGSRRFDALLIEKEALPWFPGALELGLLSRDVHLIVDYDDAVFHKYDQHTSLAVRAIWGRKVDRLMARADLVTVGNEYLAERAIKAGSRRVELVPTVIDLLRYPLRPHSEITKGQVVVGWIGSPSTAKYLGVVSEILDKLRRSYQISCVAIGASEDQLIGTPFAPIAWCEDTEVSSLFGLDIGIMPLLDTPWERGKCGYKLIQYMACGLPVIASPVGVNRYIVRHGENGFLAGNEAEWTQNLERLIVDASLRARMGAAGRTRVEQEFCLQVQGPKLAQIVHGLETDRSVI